MKNYAFKEPSSSEKIGLLSGTTEQRDISPTGAKPHHRRVGVVVAILLFSWWTVVSILPSIFGSNNDAEYPDHMDDEKQYAFEEASNLISRFS